MDAPLWRPAAERIAASRMTAFAAGVESEWGVRCTDYTALQRWSVEEPSLPELAEP